MGSQTNSRSVSRPAQGANSYKINKPPSARLATQPGPPIRARGTLSHPHTPGFTGLYRAATDATPRVWQK